MSLSTQSKGQGRILRAKRATHIRELALFAILGVIMFCSKIIMELLPNIHLLGMLTMVYTIVFRLKALIPIYVYVFLNGIFAGFSPWWIPYLYIWALLWGLTMLIPKKTPKKIAAVVYPAVCGLHGFGFGILYAPAFAIISGMSFEKTLLWIGAGVYFDLTHGISNIIVGLFILPLSDVLSKLYKRYIIK